MEIDITIVAAQVVNFILLMWLLNRFLYKPIVNVISTREAAVEQRIQRAELLQAEARSELDAYRLKRAELEQAEERLLNEARAQARRALDDLLQQAADDVRSERRRLREQLAAEQAEMERALQAGIIQQAGDMAEQLLRDMAGQRAGDGVITALARRLEEQPSMSAEMRPPLTVRLSFAPTADQTTRLRALLGRATGLQLSDEDVTFIHDDSLLLGAEIQFDGTVLSWHARDYIASWQADALRRLEVESEVDTDALGA